MFFFTVYILVSLNLFEIFQNTQYSESGGMRNLNTNKVGFVKAVFFDFCKFMSWTASE